MHGGAWPNATGCRLGGVVLSESKASRRIASKGCTVQCIDIDGWQGGQCGRPRLEADTTGEP